jgi:parvulin-like peptidyl-prolyl isomerase
MRARRVSRMAVVPLVAGMASAVARGEVINRVVATIDGEPITAYQLRQYGEEHGRPPETALLEVLITNTLLEKEIKAQGIDVSDEDVDRYVAEVRARNRMTEEEFSTALAAQGLDPEQYRKQVKSEIERARLVNMEIQQRVNVSPEEVQRHYEARLDQYEIAERVKVRDIVFPVDDPTDEAEVARVRARVEEVRARALDGDDFDELARQFSAGPGADTGGELGVFGRGEMEPALDEAAFALARGEVSEPVLARGAFHLLRVDERIAADHKPLDEVQDEIRESLYNEALEERFQKWLTRDLREQHHVEVLD